MKSLLVHDPTQPEVRYQQIRIILGRPEKQIFRLQVTMYNAVIMQVCYSTEGCPYQVCGIGFVIGAFTAYAIEELSAEGEICD